MEARILYALLLIGIIILLLLACTYFANHQRFRNRRLGPSSDQIRPLGNGPALDVAAQLEASLSASTQQSRRHKQKRQHVKK